MPVLFQLTPLDENGEPVELAALTVVGKNISRRGLSFYHNEPLLYRRAMITVDHAGFDGFSAEIDISWCRFAKPGWYESGGRLLALTHAQPDSVVNRRASLMPLPAHTPTRRVLRSFGLFC